MIKELVVENEINSKHMEIIVQKESELRISALLNLAFI